MTGAAAAAPGIGTGIGITLTVSDVATFFGASAAFTFAVASVHGIEVTDTARRRALLLATILGEEGATTVGEMSGLGPVAFAGALLTRVPTARNLEKGLELLRSIVQSDEDEGDDDDEDDLDG